MLTFGWEGKMWLFSKPFGRSCYLVAAEYRVESNAVLSLSCQQCKHFFPHNGIFSFFCLPPSQYLLLEQIGEGCGVCAGGGEGGSPIAQAEILDWWDMIVEYHLHFPVFIILLCCGVFRFGCCCYFACWGWVKLAWWVLLGVPLQLKCKKWNSLQPFTST